MIKHIVMWKLEEVAEGNTRDYNAQYIKENLEALPEVIDGILKLEVGRNVNPKGFDLVLCSEFVSMDALKAYDSHPAHLRVREFVRKVIVERVVADYEV